MIAPLTDTHIGDNVESDQMLGLTNIILTYLTKDYMGGQIKLLH